MLEWKANKRNCVIELKDINIEVVVRAFDEATEAIPFCEDKTEASEAQLVLLRVLYIWILAPLRYTAPVAYAVCLMFQCCHYK